MYNYIDYAEKTGLFCVVDWHVEGGNPNNYYGENFLDSISLYVKKKNYKHVIYEICNEPGNIKWSEIKDYASRALSTIQYNDPSAVVIVGTPQWSQSFDEVINSPIESDSLNILYAFHYSACSHEQMLSNLKKAAKSIPVFVSEWSTSDWEGKIDSPCDKESLELMDVCEGNNDGFQKISWCALGWGDHNRSGSVAFRSCSDVNADDLYNSLLPSGQFVYSLLNPVQICCAAGVSDEEISSKAIFIYSNPSDGVFEVKLPTSEAAEVTIFNMIGEIVYQGLIENDKKISTNLSIGQYILVVKTENNVYNEKLVVR